MTSVPQGYAPLFSPDGQWVSYGYQSASCLRVANPADVRTAPSPGGAIWPCGWFDAGLMAFERPMTAPDGSLVVELWSFDIVTGETTLTNYDPDQWPGHNALPVINGRVLSYQPHTKRLYYEHADVTPDGQTVEGPQWDGAHVLYQNSQEVIAGAWWMTYVRRLSDGAVLHALAPQMTYAKPYEDLGGQCWVSAYEPGYGASVWSPDGVKKHYPGEGVGPVTDGFPDSMMVWTCLSSSDGQQRGVFGRRWSDPIDAPGVYVEGIWHSGLTGMETAGGWLLAGYRTDTGEIRFTAVPYDAPRVPKPTWEVEPPAELPPHQPTIPVTATVNAPRWICPYFGGYLTDSRMPTLEVWQTDPTECPGTAHSIGHPYLGHNDIWELSGRPPYGWSHYVSNGGTRPVIADQWTAPEVPDGLLIAVRADVEGSDDWSDRNKLEIANARLMARKRGVPCLLYQDMLPLDARWSQRLNLLLAAQPEAADEELIPEVPLYPNTYELGADAVLWRRGLTVAQTAVRAGGNRLAIGRKCYVRIDDTISYVEGAQPIQCVLANEFKVFADRPFSGWRVSGIYIPTQVPTPLPSNRAVLEPWLTALADAAKPWGQPTKIVLQPQPPVDAGPLVLHVTQTAGRVPFTLGVTVHQGSGPAPVSSYRFWEKRQPFGKYQVVGNTTQPEAKIRFLIPGRYSLHVQDVTRDVNSESVTITATSPVKPSSGGGSLWSLLKKLKFW